MKSVTHAIRGVIEALLPHCALVEVRHGSTGSAFKILRVGGDQPTERHFFIGQIAEAIERQTEFGRIPIWRIAGLHRKTRPNFTLLHLNRGLANAADRVLKLLKTGSIRLPQEIEINVDLTKTENLAKARKKDIKSRTEERFKKEVSTSSADLLTFIKQYRDPYIKKRHGLDSLIYPYPAEILRKASIAGSGFSLLKILDADEWVAAATLLKQGHEETMLFEVGIKNGDTAILKNGAIAALYWHAIEHLQNRGERSASFSFTRPFLNNGVFRFKSKFEPALTLKSGRRALIIPDFQSTVARRILTEQPMICEAGGKLTPTAYVLEHADDGPWTSLEPFLKRCQRLEKPETRVLPPAVHGTEPVQHTRLQTAAKPYPTDRCIHDLFLSRAVRHREQPAVQCAGHTLTYAELEALSGHLAQRLRRHGAKPNAVIAVCADRSARLPAYVLGVLRSGSAYLPLDPALPTERLRFMLKDAGALAVVVDASTAHLLDDGTAPCAVISAQDIPITGAVPAEDPDEARPQASDLAYIIYTSGSTGLPKGVAIEHTNLMNVVWDMQERLALRPGERVLSIGSFAFDVTLPDWFWAFMTGGVVIMADTAAIRAPALLAGLIQDARPTHIQATPGTWALLLDCRLAIPKDVRLVTTGEHVREAVRERLRAISDQVWNLYGPTETTVWSSAAQLNQDKTLDSIGLPIANTRFYILDKSGEPVATGERGELWIGGAGVARGYLNRPELTAERFSSPAWAGGDRLYKTGDWVAQNADGSLHYWGRMDDQVKIRGYRVELGEIDSKLMAQAGICQSQTLLVDNQNSQRIVSFVVTETPDLDMSAIKTALARVVPAYMVPAKVLRLASLPLTPNGKVDREMLLAQLERHASDDDADTMTPMEQKVAAIWKETLGIKALEVNDTFWDLGGDSLSAARMLVDVERVLGMEISHQHLHEHPTLRDFCASGLRLPTPTDRFRQIRKGSQGAKAVIFTHGHGFSNEVDNLAPVMFKLDAEHDVWGLSGHGRDGRHFKYQSLEAMGQEAVELIRGHLSTERITVVGYCLGGLLALELAHQLAKAGYCIENVVLIDTFRPEKDLPDSTKAHWKAQTSRTVSQRRRAIWGSMLDKPATTIPAWAKRRLAWELHKWNDKTWRAIGPTWSRLAAIPTRARHAHYKHIQERAFLNYSAPFVQTRIHLIKSTSYAMPYGWENYTPEVVETSLPATHGEMFHEGKAMLLAAAISATINERAQ